MTKKTKTGAIIITSTVIMITAVIAVFAQTSATLMPVKDGNYKQFTPKSGSSHYTMVDESACNGLSDYNYTNTVGYRDSYGLNISSIPNGAVINSISIIPCASANKTGATSIVNVFYRFNGTNSSDAGKYSLSGTTPTVKAATVFSNLSLTKGSASTLEVGTVLSSGSTGVRLSNVSTQIGYTVNTLAAPSGLTVTAFSTSTYAYLNWVDNSNNETGYYIERGTDGLNFVQIASVLANVTGYTDHVGTAGTYYYRVRGYNAGGYSAYSNTVSVVLH